MQFQRLLLLLLVASNSGKRYWDWTLPRIRAQIELSSTFVYDCKMSTSGSSAKSSHLTQGGRMTMMPMPVNWITSQCKNKIIVKILPVNKFTTLKFLSLLPSMNGQFFLDYHVLLCNKTCNTLSFVPSGWEANSWQTAVHAHFLVVNKGAGQFYLSFKILWKSYLQSFNAISDEFQHPL